MRRSLGVLLALCLAGLQFLAVLAVVFSSYLTSERALLEHARDLLRDVGTNTIEHSKGFLNPARGAAELAARLAENRVVASDDPKLLEQLLFQQLQIAPQFAGVYYGGTDGFFVMVSRTPNEAGPFRTKVITVEDGKRTVELIWRRNDFEVVGRKFDPADPYDPRTRPWYIKAAHDLTTIWTDPYIFFSSQQPGITLSAPVLKEGGGIRGAIGVDIEINMISEFLARLQIGANGRALIMHRNGDVIAHPELHLIKAENNDGTLRFANIREIDDPIARAAFGDLAENGEIRIEHETPSQFSYKGATYVSTVMPVISDILPWTIAVYAPEDDFTNVIKRNRAQNIWIAAAVAMLTGLIGLGLADYIHRPVRAFAVRSALIAQGEIDPDAPAPRTYKELAKANTALVQQIVARRDAEREYGQTFDLSSRAMAQIAPEDGGFIRVNARFCEITGYSAPELAGMRFIQMVHPEDAEIALAEERDGLGSLATNLELRCIRKNGLTIWVTLNAILIRDEKGLPLHAVVTMDDITQNKANEAQIVQLSRDLSHLARGNTMGQMAAGLAHELNQPLTAIAQNAGTALLTVDDYPDLDPELREIIGEIESQALRAGEIIRALRGFIRKDEGRSAAFDFAELLRQTLRLVQPEATEAGVRITSEAEGLPLVSGNRTQIAQVLVNLLRNAVEAMHGHGKNERDILVHAHGDGDNVTVSVEDTGPGVDTGINLFAQFETTKAEGMGLGLSIARSIIEGNGGRIWHEPNGAGGARFSFTLPVTGRV